MSDISELIESAQRLEFRADVGDMGRKPDPTCSLRIAAKCLRKADETITRLRAELAEARKAPTEPHLEFRPFANGEFDEIVARFADGTVHVETMSDKRCYVQFSWNDGRFCQWYISSGKALKYHHEQGKDAP